MAKNNSKSIRVSDVCLNYILNYRGNGFNEKFENIILDAMESESERVKILQNLDKRIEASQTQLQVLLDKYDQLNPYLRKALELDSRIDELRTILKNQIK